MTQDQIQKIIHSCDHTLLKVDATWEQIRALCDEAVQYGTASVCIPPSCARQAVEYLEGRPFRGDAAQDVQHPETNGNFSDTLQNSAAGGRTIPVCVVIGFPNGYSTTASKVFEARDAIVNGASEVDMVINVGWVKDGLYDRVLDEIQQVKAAVGSHILKVIIETCLLTEEEKIRMCGIVTESGADYIKTSTGFSTGGATFADVKLMKEHVGPDVRIKAAGGIASLEDAWQFLELGASRLGTSRIIRLVKELPLSEG